MSTLPFHNTVDPVALLSSLARHQAPLSMSHPFHGVVLTQDLSLISLNPDSALVRVGRQWLATGPGERIYLHSPMVTEVLAARVMGINSQSGELSLGDFSLQERPWAERGHERVQPRLPIHATVRWNEQSFSAALEDFSVNGAGLLAYKLRERGMDLQVGQALKLDFDLHQPRTHLALPARLANIRYHGGHLACLGIVTYPTINQARSIGRFIEQRKVEILAELDEMYQQTFQPQSVKELYF